MLNTAFQPSRLEAKAAHLASKDSNENPSPMAAAMQLPKDDPVILAAKRKIINGES